MDIKTKTGTNNQTTTQKLGWAILLGASVLLILGGVFWFRSLPDMAMENIAEYAGIEPGTLTQGSPNAGIVIALIARGYGAGFAILGLMALLVGLEGFRHGTRWAWTATWALVLAYAAIGGIFLMAGESAALSLSFFFIAGIAIFGLALARSRPKAGKK